MFCQAIKNKSSPNIQCTNKCKPNENLCGVHLKSKDTVLFVKQSDTNVEENVSTCHLENQSDSSEKEDLKKIYSIEDLFEKVIKNETISVFSLRNSIKKTYVEEFVKTKVSKQQILNDLRSFIEKERFWKSNVHSIIMIQKMIRGWSIYRRKLCCNETDILTFGDKYEIPKLYFTVLVDYETDFRYGYDLRTLVEIYNQEIPSCPYTSRKFTELELESITYKIRKASFLGIDLGIFQIEFSEQQKIEMNMKDIFQKFDMLDNYTNYRWFKNLSLPQLCDLYFRTEDIWNYRSSMDMDTRCRIVNNGMAFNLSHQFIHNISSKYRLQQIILDEYNRFATEGVNRDEKKLGVMLMLTGLVEVSGDAADAMPHLIQI